MVVFKFCRRYQKLQKIMKPCFGDMLSFTLTAFVELMDHGIVSWDTFSVAFIKKIASFVNKSAIDISILQRSLAILESMVLNSHDLYQKVAQEITIGQLIPHLQGSDQEIQTYTIAVINALFLKAPDERRQEMANILAQKQLRSIILTHVIRAQRAINNEMAHQLYVLQVLTFNLLEDRMMTKMDPQDQAQRDIIFELRRIAFDAESEPNNSSGSMEKRKSMYTRDYKKLGFINHVNPAMDFTQTPPGMLALDNMLYFAKHHQDAYIRLNGDGFHGAPPDLLHQMRDVACRLVAKLLARDHDDLLTQTLLPVEVIAQAHVVLFRDDPGCLFVVLMRKWPILESPWSKRFQIVLLALSKGFVVVVVLLFFMFF
uniref:Engulfment and cell motility 1 n=1 Tax=Callithrix jacchus TaxID=9483 RepID=A0A8I3W1K2_CALJA